MGQLFSRITDNVTDMNTTPIGQTPKNKFFKKIAIDPRSPTFGEYNRTPIRVPQSTTVSTNTPNTPMNYNHNNGN